MYFEIDDEEGNNLPGSCLLINPPKDTKTPTNQNKSEMYYERFTKKNLRHALKD